MHEHLIERKAGLKRQAEAAGDTGTAADECGLAGSTAGSSSSAAGRTARSAASPPPQPSKRRCKKRRKSRAIPKAPVKELLAHSTVHFRNIVHQFTGLPLLTAPRSPPPPPPVLPALMGMGCDSIPASADHPALASSVIALSLRSTLHAISACLQLLQRSSRNSNLAAQTEKLAMAQNQACHQGVLDPRSVSTDHASDSFEIDSFLSDLASNSVLDSDFPIPNPNEQAFCSGASFPSPLHMHPDTPCHNAGLQLPVGDYSAVGDPSKSLFSLQTSNTPPIETLNNPASNSYNGCELGGYGNTLMPCALYQS